jgi:tRNA A-37 threonylcarbamoyl transferase component Bud32
VLRECIGEGAFAAVYRSEQPLLGREAVVKVLHQRLRDSEVVFQRFMREARLASRLDHPYAAHVYAFGVEPDDGLAWIAMELVHGTSLARWLSDRGSMPLDMLVAFFEQVAEIVQNAHDHGIVHRDLKPSNVMMMEYAGKIFPKLLDFGIAKLVDETVQAGRPGSAIELEDTLSPEATDSGNVHLTQANATLGSPPYMSPEQWCDPLSVGPRSDLYSLGVMAYEALTGRQPFTGDTIAAIGEQHCNAPIPPVGARLPAALDRVFQRALAKSPEDRPASALAFARELRAAAFPRSPGIESTIRTQALASLGRRRWWPVAAGVAALVVCAFAAYLGAPAAVTALTSPRYEKVRPPGSASGSEDRDPAGDPAPPAPPPGSGGSPPPVSPKVATAVAPEVAAPVAPPVAPAVANPTMVRVEIASLPPGAAVFRLPAGIKVGSTPWSADVPSEAGAQVFLIKKRGFADEIVEVDLRTGGKRAVRLQLQKPAAPPVSGKQSPVRREGEPIDPFRPGGA